MRKELLAATAVKKSKKRSKVCYIKMNDETYKKLKKNEVDIAKTVNVWLEMFAENLPK